MPPRINNALDIESIELKLADPSTTATLVEEYYRFGQLLVSELASRSGEVERKLITLMGWSLAGLGFLGLQTPMGILPKMLTILAILGALASAILCGIGLRTRMWAVPSPADWFKPHLLDGETLKRYHVVSLFNMHQSQSSQIARKADILARAEALAAGFAVTIAALAAGRLLS